MSREYTVKLYEEEMLRGILHIQAEENLLRILQRQGYLEGVPCGGKGICGACGVRIVKGAPLPGSGDRKFFSPEQLRGGMRLSCTVPVKDDMEVVLPKRRKDPTVLLKTTVCAEENEDGVRGAKEDIAAAGEADYCRDIPDAVMVVDIGTTTIAMELKSTAAGKTLAQYASLNPQRKYGADVLSRIEAASGSEETAKILKKMLRTVLQQGISYFKEAVPEWMSENTPVFVAGNTTMEHLFMGYPVEGLGKYPFTPVSLDWQETECAGHRVILLPGFSAFIGADITAGAAALGLFETADDVLLIDLGTNAEMVYVHAGTMTVTATAAGPAFEGGITAGVFGADLISMAAGLLEQGILDETGLLQGDAFEQGAVVGGDPDRDLSGIRIKNEDIRKLQLAKAAVAAGVEMLAVSEKTQVYLAGGFGYYLERDSACRIGLLPGIKKEQIHAVGNIVPAGIFAMAKQYLADAAYAKKAAERLKTVKIVNLAETAGFHETYLHHINFP